MTVQQNQVVEVLQRLRARAENGRAFDEVAICRPGASVEFWEGCLIVWRQILREIDFEIDRQSTEPIVLSEPPTTSAS